MDDFYILDGHYLIYRAYHAMSNAQLEDSQGRPTGAVFGFLRMLLAVFDQHEPDYLVCSLDSEEPTFRHEFYEDYKAERPEMPDDLRAQIPMIRELFDTLQIPVMIEPGYECDDLIASAVDRWKDNPEIQFTIVSNDKDNFQLVEDRVRTLKINQGFSDVEFLHSQAIEDELGVPPDQVPDYLALVGDKIDNVPGVEGIGPTYASRLLAEFPTIEEMLERSEQISNVVSDRLTKAILENKQQLRDSKHLVVLKKDAPIDNELEEFRFDGLKLEPLIDFCREYDLRSIKQQLRERRSGTEPWQEAIEEIWTGSFPEFVSEKRWQKADRVFGYIDHGPDDPKPMEVTEVNLIWTDGSVGWFVNLDLTSESADEYRTFLDQLEDRRAITHNQKYLQLLGFRLGVISSSFPVTLDLQLASYLVDPDSGDQLNQILDRILDRPVPERPENPEQERNWLIHRADRMRSIEEELESKLESREQSNILERLEAPLTRILARMEYNGIAVDREHLRGLSQEISGTLQDLQEKAYELADEEFNLNSPKQLREILFEKLKLPVQGKTGSGKPSTDADTLEILRSHHPIAEVILEYRRYNKIESTYLRPLVEEVNEETDRIHTEFNQTVAATGRLSSSRPNLQNIPVRDEFGRNVRAAFTASRDDYRLIAADYSQVELRLLAHISADERLQEAFREDRDIHSMTAADLFDKTLSEIDESDRRVAKVVNYGITYGLSAYGLANDLDISQAEAQEYIDRYFERYPGVSRYIEETIDIARKQGYVETLRGRRRYLSDLNSENYHQQQFAERAAVNAPIQGTAADIMKKAMIDLEPQLEQLPVRLLLQVHDELVLEADQSCESEIIEIVREGMTGVIDLDVPLTVSIKSGANWAQVSK